MNDRDRRAFRAMAPDLRLVEITHMHKRPAGGAWHVAICAVGSSAKAAFVPFVTRSRTHVLPANPADWNVARTEPICDPSPNLAAAHAVARGFVLGRWGRWTI